MRGASGQIGGRLEIVRLRYRLLVGECRSEFCLPTARADEPRSVVMRTSEVPMQ